MILHSQQAAVDLLDKRSSTYSDRPKSLIVDLYVHRIRFMDVCALNAVPILLQDGMELEHASPAVRRGMETYTEGVVAALHIEGRL